MKCVICGKEIEKSSYLNAVLCSSECFSIHFWRECLSDPATLINEKMAYHVGNEKDRGGFRGFGGRAFYIKMLKDTQDHKAGDIFRTTNLWSNGGIPDDMYNPDMDNFVFIKKEEYDEIQGNTVS